MERSKFTGLMCLLWAISVAGSPHYPDTLRVPVTFYDFHSDGSNPEFETVPACTGGVWAGMIDTTISMYRKPLLGSHPFFDLSIDRWFMPWMPGDSGFPNYGAIDPNTGDYALANAAGSTPMLLKTNNDTAFKNIVIQDTLFFTLIPGSGGMYQFDDQSFFPLDGKGFGAEGKDHNFSFTMEMHWKFTMAAGLRFQFTGDDDVWAFINDRLVMDLGGRHAPQTAAIDLDSLREELGLTIGLDYAFDFFYCERHTSDAILEITSSIVKSWSDSAADDCSACLAVANGWEKGPNDCERIENRNEWWQDHKATEISLHFGRLVDTFSVTLQNIDSLFPLSSGCSWVPRKGGIDCFWNEERRFEGMETAMVLTVQYQCTGSFLSDTPIFFPPTISIGDTIRCARVRFKTVLTGTYNCLWNEMMRTPIKGNQKMLLPAQGILGTRSYCTEKGFVFDFPSSAAEVICIRVIDLFGRCIEEAVPEDVHKAGRNRFSWNYRDKRFNKRTAKGIYFVQVLIDDKLVKSIPFFSH